MNFLEALTVNDIYTENAMPTHSTSGSALLDMFFKMGGSRGMSERDIVQSFTGAFGENPLLGTKAMFYNRDVRGGQGERRSFRIMFRALAFSAPEIARKNIFNVPYYGRWDDLLVGLKSPVEDDVLDYILYALKSGDKLCAKWMPREGKSLGEVAKYLMRKWGLTPRDYRKLLAGNTYVVENLMCAKEWGAIVYEHVPSVAMKKYRKAFGRNDQERFAEFLTAVEKGEKKIHADAIFPHDIVKAYLPPNAWHQSFSPLDKALELQWQALPNYLPEGQSIMPVCDVSGSMYGLALDVCVSLGIYLSERNKGPFADHFITFSGRPVLQKLTGDTLHGKVQQLAQAHWDGNTNLEAVFNLILKQAQMHSVSEEDMPRNILILSDMQFDECVRQPSQNALAMIQGMYLGAGYQMPNVVFWNLRTSLGVPVKFDERGTALVSGFSPSIMKSIFNGDLEPIKVAMRTLESERYDRVTI